MLPSSEINAQCRCLVASFTRSTSADPDTNNNTNTNANVKKKTLTCSDPHSLLIHLGRNENVASIATGCYLLSRSNYSTDTPGGDVLPAEFIQVLTTQLKGSLKPDPETKYSPTAACVGTLIDCLGTMRVVKDDVVSAGLDKIIGKLHRRVKKVIDQEGGTPNSHEICGGADPKIVHKALATLTMKWGALWEKPVKATEEDPLMFLALRKRLEVALAKQKEEEFKMKKKETKAPSTMKHLRAKRKPTSNALLKSAEEEIERLRENKRKADIQFEMAKKKRILKEKSGVKMVKKVTFAPAITLRTIQTFCEEDEPTKVGDAVRSPSLLLPPVPDVPYDEDAIDASFFEVGGDSDTTSFWLDPNKDEDSP